MLFGDLACFLLHIQREGRGGKLISIGCQTENDPRFPPSSPSVSKPPSVPSSLEAGF